MHGWYLRAAPAQTGEYDLNAMPAPVAQRPQDELGRHVFEGACANYHQYSGNGRQTVGRQLRDRAFWRQDGRVTPRMSPSGDGNSASVRTINPSSRSPIRFRP
jgi:hypothetical protein